MNTGEAGPSAAALPPSLLAPGFRFHPTDEELVIYYLKRKLLGRPLLVDAIGELDLYKWEPWDLPALSRLRSRDVEWYFFSSLDRKYANRSRTNRATPQGYWKTTGKDRPVQHAGRIVGMKKTLVFHAGRAPRGQRTNWVMHEYRLEGPLLPQSQVPQDAYVVCRIFRKNGSGPQNGAQYGAPFVEEEWEEEEGDDVVPQDGNCELMGALDQDYLPQDGNCELMEALDQDYLQMIDFEENADLVNQQENTALLTRVTVEQNGDGQQEEPTILVEDILNDHSLINDVDAYINMPEEDDQPFINDMEENTDMGHTDGSLTQSDGFVELNDLVKSENASSLSDMDIIGSPLWTPTDLLNDADGSSILPDMNGGEEFFDIINENFEQMEPFQMSSAVQDDIYQQPNNFLNPASGDYPSWQSIEDVYTFFDASSHELGQENFTQMNDLLYAPMANPSGLDMVDEYLAFFDATDANLHYASLDSLEKSENADSCNFGHSNFAQQVDGGSIPTSKASAVASSSSARLPSVDHSSSGENVDGCGAPDVPGNESGDKPLTKRLVNMLGSISSPPALAAEFPAKAVNQFALSSGSQGSSIHVTAGMIHIRSSAVTASGEHWSVQKNGSVGFLLSYGMAGNGGKPGALEPTTKVHGGALTVVLRDWFYFFFFSALFLAASFRIGVCIYSK